MKTTAEFVFYLFVLIAIICILSTCINIVDVIKEDSEENCSREGSSRERQHYSMGAFGKRERNNKITGEITLKTE